MNGAEAPILEVEDLTVRFRTRRGRVQALTGASFTLQEGGLKLLVGESGSGKSVLAHCLLRLLPRNTSIGGAVRLGGDELLQMPEKSVRRVRGRRISLIPQSPGAALSPFRRLGPQLLEAAGARGLSGKAAKRSLTDLLEELSLDYEELRRRYIHQLSGGMQQRLVNALALVGEPEVVIADEPTSGLDADLVTVMAGQLEKVRERGAALLVITHDLRLARRLGGSISLLYAGRIVEQRGTGAFFDAPAHPYGQALLCALPERGGTPVPGLPPELTDLPPGCAFAPRCPKRFGRCTEEVPGDYPLPAGGTAACFLHDAREAGRGA